MDRDEWIRNAIYLIHVGVPAITADHADDLADDLFNTCAELEPDEAVAMFLFAMGTNWTVPPLSRPSRRQHHA